MKLYAVLPWIQQTLIWLPVKIGFKILYDIQVRGVENLEGIKTGVIFASNHTSELDPVLIPSSLPFLSRFSPMFYTCREKSFYKDIRFGLRRYIYGGIFFTIWGAYEVYTGIKNYEDALVHHLQILKSGDAVCIFPEGRKNVTGKRIQPKGGVVFLAHRAHVPIIPVKITGIKERKNVTVTFGKPIDAPALLPESQTIIISKERDDYKIAASKLMQLIESM